MKSSGKRNYTNDFKKEAFINFLKEHNALIPYCVNVSCVTANSVHGRHNRPLNLTFSQSLKAAHVPERDPYYTHINSFIWNDSKEGFDFWFHLYNLWEGVKETL